MTSPVPSSLSTVGPISSTNITLLSDLLESLSSKTSKTYIISSTSSLHSSTLDTYTSITDASITLVASSSAFTASSQSNIIQHCIFNKDTFYISMQLLKVPVL